MTFLLGFTQIVAAGLTFTCTPISVWDGDGPIWCAEGPRIRLVGIAAREMDGTCRKGHPCPKASGIAARDELVKLLGGAKGITVDGHVIVRSAPMVCLSDGSAKGKRTAASCRIKGKGDVSRAMIRTGTVLAWDYRKN